MKNLGSVAVITEELDCLYHAIFLIGERNIERCVLQESKLLLTILTHLSSKEFVSLFLKGKDPKLFWSVIQTLLFSSSNFVFMYECVCSIRSRFCCRIFDKKSKTFTIPHIAVHHIDPPTERRFKCTLQFYILKFFHAYLEVCISVWAYVCVAFNFLIHIIEAWIYGT